MFSLPNAIISGWKISSKFCKIDIYKYSLSPQINNASGSEWQRHILFAWSIWPLPLNAKVTTSNDIFLTIQTFSSSSKFFSVTFIQDHLWIPYIHSCFMRLRWSLWLRLLLPKCLWNHFLSHIFASCTTCLTIKTLCPSALGWSL